MAYAARYAGRVKKGQLVLSDPAAWRIAVGKHEGRDVWVTVVRQLRLHTDNQRKYYFGVVVDMVAAEIGESKEETHELLKWKFLGPRRIELLNGRFLEMPPRFRDLDIERTTKYIDEIKVWAASFLSLSIPDAGEVEVTL
jgi:hypothetical protein